MSVNTENVDERNYIRIAAWSAVPLILLVPLVAMRFSDEVNWTVFDFAIAAVLLIGVGVAFEFVVRNTGSTAYRIAFGLALAAALLLIWINGAVGIIGDETNKANLMYAGVLAVGFIGALIAGLRAQGMVIAMFSAAVAQVLVAVIALIGGMGTAGPIWPLDILGVTGFFTALWVTSAFLFRRAADVS